MTSPQSFEIVRASFARQSLMQTLGATLTSVRLGAVEIDLPHGEHIAQQHGFAHAGAVAAIADSACGYACLTEMPEGSNVLSIEFKINMLSPASGELLRARAQTIRVGRTIAVARAEVVSIERGEEERCVAVMQATMMRVELGGTAG